MLWSLTARRRSARSSAPSASRAPSRWTTSAQLRRRARRTAAPRHRVVTRRSAFSVGAGTVIGATAAAGLAWGGYHLAVSTEGKDTGPTAATLNEAFATYYGVMAGLALGAASGLAASRRRSPALALGSSLGAAALFALALAVTGR